MPCNKEALLKRLKKLSLNIQVSGCEIGGRSYIIHFHFPRWNWFRHDGVARKETAAVMFSIEIVTLQWQLPFLLLCTSG